MFNEKKALEKIKLNIAVSNFEAELNANEKAEEYAHKNYWRINEMKKTILAITCCGIMIISGVVYAYGKNFSFSSKFFKQENQNYLNRQKQSISNNEVKGQEDIYLNGYLISRPFEKNINEKSILEHGHNGIDIVAERGTKVLAVADGIIKETNYNFQYGNYIIIKYDEEYETLYAHLEKINVEEGDSVLHGDEIGTVGATGTVTGPCLHFELRHNGEPVNPMDYIDKIKE